MATGQRTKSTADAVEILHRRYVRGKPEMERLLQEERENAAVAREIHSQRFCNGKNHH
jgi:hypothetical protein